jgi:tetratricopeptide (TPR) repeat protein
MENKAEIAVKLERANVLILGLLFLLLPLGISLVNTDAFAIPKQFILLVAAFLGLLLLAAKTLFLRAVRLRRTPFDLPLLALVAAAFISSVLAVNRWDSLTSFVPFMFAALLFFVMTNSAKRAQDFLFLSSALIIGAVISSAVGILSYLKIYILPFGFAKIQTFSTFGSLFDQSIYLLIVLAFALYLAWPSLQKRSFDKGRAVFSVGSLLLLVGTAFSVLATFTLQKPQILPFQNGFQIAFASISQDTGRVVQGFLSGSGIGTFLTDFTRYKPATINKDAALWSLSFLRSSSFVLEILATTGVLGILAYVFLAWRIVKSKPLFLPLILVLVLSLIIPFSFPIIFLMFAVLGLYSVEQGLSERQKTRFFDVDLKLMTLRKGVFALSDSNSRSDSEYGNLLPWAFSIIVVLFLLLFGYYSVRFFYSDYLFQKSLVAASQNNAQATYQLETQAINIFPQRDGYHRIFSQINLSLANNIASGIPQGGKPTTQQQQTIYQLIQQSINSARAATTVSPQNALNWQNLSSIYRSLIGFGQNADTFAVIANQQALVLDPNNPQEYINYGGIFYQLGQWDNAINQFQIAVNLKPDFANAHYNLGHALEQKGSLQDALNQYLIVKQLVAKDPQSLAQINSEISAVQNKIGAAAKAQTPKTEASAENQPPLQVNQPTSQLPEQNPPVKIPGPKTSPTTSPTPTKAK